MEVRAVNRWISKRGIARLGIIMGLVGTGLAGSARPTAAGPNLWTSVGPRAFHGPLAADAQGRLVAVAGTSADSTGVYRSADGGQTWALVGDYALAHRDYTDPLR